MTWKPKYNQGQQLAYLVRQPSFICMIVLVRKSRNLGESFNDLSSQLRGNGAKKEKGLPDWYFNVPLSIVIADVWAYGFRKLFKMNQFQGSYKPSASHLAHVKAGQSFFGNALYGWKSRGYYDVKWRFSFCELSVPKSFRDVAISMTISCRGYHAFVSFVKISPKQFKLLGTIKPELFILVFEPLKGPVLVWGPSFYHLTYFLPQSFMFGKKYFCHNHKSSSFRKRIPPWLCSSAGLYYQICEDDNVDLTGRHFHL